MLEPDRLLSPKTSAEDRYDRALRPKSLNDYIGQKTVKDQMGIFIEACLLYTSTIPRDGQISRIPSSA